MRSLRRYVRLFGVFARTCAVREMEFRGNFWAYAFAGVAWVGVYLAVAHIIYANTNAVGGWTKGQMVMLLGTYTLSFAIIGVFFSNNLAQLPNQVRMGTFDFTLVKPVSSQFFVSMRYLNFGEIGTLLGAVCLLLYGAALEHVHISLAGAIGYTGMLLCGVIIFYCLYLILMTSAFWFVKVDNLWTLAETVSQVARTPLDIYGPMAKRVFTFVLPLIFIAHVPAQVLFRGLRWHDVTLALSICVILLFVSSRFWTFATRFYSSASS